MLSGLLFDLAIMLCRVTRTGIFTPCRSTTWKRSWFLAAIGIHANVIAMKHLAVQNLDGQGILDQALDRSLQRTSSILPVVSGQQQLMTSRRRSARA